MSSEHERVIARRGSVFCPLTGREEVCTFVEDADTEALIGVTSCSRYSPPDQVPCDQRCVEMLNAGYRLDSDGDG